MKRLVRAYWQFLVAQLGVVLARRGIYLAPTYPIKVDRIRDYSYYYEYDDYIYRQNAHAVMERAGWTTCSTMHPDDFHPGSEIGCLACDVEARAYRPRNLIVRFVLGTRHSRALVREWSE